MTIQNPAGADGALKTFAKQLGKNADKQPGWMYLLAVAFLTVPFARLPSRVPNELWATLIAVIAYGLGDAIDKVTFKHLVKKPDGRIVWEPWYLPQAHETAKGKAETNLGIKAGLYDVSMRLLEAGHEARFSVHWVNEISKFLRSLLVPAVFVAMVQLSRTLPFVWALSMSAITVVGAVYLATRVYPKVKTAHITSLYESIPGLVAEKNDQGQKKLECFDVECARLFFWEGKFVASAKKADLK